jgi:uncharacterized RDD family membrane protein YckC
MLKRRYLKKSSESNAKLSRVIAKGIDLFICFLLSFFFYPVGILLGVFYISISDYLQKGQSVGKRLIGFSVIDLEEMKPCTMRQSIIRNLPLSVPLFFAIFPFWGWIISIVLGLILCAFEFYLLFKINSGKRLGDVMADTSVVLGTGEQQHTKKSSNSGWFENSSQMSMQ